MPRQPVVYDVFVSCPNDVKDERNALIESVRWMNKSWRTSGNALLEVISWEDVYPAVAGSAQEVIDKQVGLSYDIYLGILWYRIGTKLASGETGTTHEFKRALESRETNDSKDILFYFKTENPPYEELSNSPESIKEVLEFKAYLKEKGIFYREFKSTDEFSNYVRMDLSNLMNTLEKKNATLSRTEENEFTQTNDDTRVAKEEPCSVSPHADSSLDEPGLIDTIEAAQSAFNDLNPVLNRILEATQAFSAAMVDSTLEINSATSGPSVDLPLIRASLDKLHGRMDGYANSLQIEVPRHNELFTRALDSMFKSYVLTQEFGEPDPDFHVENAIMVDTLIKVLDEVSSQIDGMKGSLDILPRVDVKINRVKKRISFLLATFISDMKSASRQATKLQELILGVVPAILSHPKYIDYLRSKNDR